MSDSTPSLTRDSRSPASTIISSPPVQPDHFYKADESVPTPTLDDEEKDYLDPKDDPLCLRGIPVFKPSMEDFRDFEAYVTSIEPWGSRSGIVKILPPQQWLDSLPDVRPMLRNVKIKSPIEQNLIGQSGRFTARNMVRRKEMSVREWSDLCAQDDYRAPSLNELDTRGKFQRSWTKKRTRAVKVKIEEGEEEETTALRRARAKEERERADGVFLDTFDPHKDWLPPHTKATDYTPDACRQLERSFWRGCGIAKPAWYGADTSGSLFTNDVTSWNVASLPGVLQRLLKRPVPGVNTPYLYFGMWRATFAWHVEDMDLFSINYIHFGAGKHWYAIPSARATAMEREMATLFPQPKKNYCSQFLRHKSCLASPDVLARASCKPNVLVQHAQEFVITFPKGYHAGFNLGLNCAESANFALESWIPLGRNAKACECIEDSVTIDVDALLRAEAGLSTPEPPESAEVEEDVKPPTKKRPKQSNSLDLPTKSPSSKRRRQASAESSMSKKPKLPSVKLRLPTAFPCELCNALDEDDLLPIYGRIGRAHSLCARIIPETWVYEGVVYGMDGISKDRWGLKCSACNPGGGQMRMRGAPVQCTKGKCLKAYHVRCAQTAEKVAFEELEGSPREVVFDDPSLPSYIIRKPTFTLLCPAHNPAEMKKKRDQKEDYRRDKMRTFAPGDRVKLRTSTGVCEVTLLRTFEDQSAIEVIWHHGVPKTFAWSRVLFGEHDVQSRLPEEVASRPVSTFMPGLTIEQQKRAGQRTYYQQPLIYPPNPYALALDPQFYQHPHHPNVMVPVQAPLAYPGQHPVAFVNPYYQAIAPSEVPWSPQTNFAQQWQPSAGPNQGFPAVQRLEEEESYP